ncbi:MAG: Rne/Rng family ribonuclease [Proteobacteria bacterium]|nr:Rne/Rng family ribonuclease [Pseudomonadota bacterium]
MIINASDPEECRIAIVEDGYLEEFYIESALKGSKVHNIYKAMIQNVEPSLQAVFVNFGAERNGFMQINDVHPEYFLVDPPERGPIDLRKVLGKGQELLVQVTKDATEIKGAALTTYISLAGQFVVLMPGGENLGVSRKIVDEDERKRLKELARDLPVPEACGVILRTSAAGRTKKDITRDFSHQVRLWEEIRKQVADLPAPCLVHKEQDLAIRTIRDHFTPEIKEILVDDPDVYERALEYVKVIAPRLQNMVKLNKDKRPIFSKYQIEEQTETIFSNEVRLKSGGAIVINPTEALVSIDVNSGRSTREARLEDTAYKTNLEAAEEVARQLRLRDLGGLIVIDFIDMRDTKHQREVEKKLKAEAKKDKAKIDTGRISKFGLLEMSRQRLRPPIEFGSFHVCEVCGGRGVIRSAETTALAALRLMKQKISKGQVDKVTGRLHPVVANYLLNQKRHELLSLESRYQVSIHLESDARVLPGSTDLEFIRKSESADAESAPPQNDGT